MSPAARPTGFVVPHTHWDREWYLTEHQARSRLVEVLDDALDRLEGDSRIDTFLLDGQLAPLVEYLALRPEMTPRVRKLVRAGRLELGPWYVLADEFLVSGETLVRNLLHGRQASAPFGSWMAIGYSPDAFGHPAVLPTVLAGFGIEHALVWRGYGGPKVDAPDLFRWSGPDGAEVLTHHLPPDGYEIARELPVDPESLRERWTALRRVLEPRSRSGHLLLLNGADHHALQPDVADAVRELDRLERRWDFRLSSLPDYFRAVRDAGRTAPPVSGELRAPAGPAWALQGVHATRSRLKRLIAEGERLLLGWAEPQAALAWVGGGRDRRPMLDDAWRRHLLSCAHDSIGGCCTDDVARDVATRAAGVIETARAVTDAALLDRAGIDRTAVRRGKGSVSPRLLAINPSPRSRGGVLEATLTYFLAEVPVGGPVPPRPPAPPAPDPVVRGPAGELLPVQLLEDGVAHERFDSPRDYPRQDVVHAVRVAVYAPDLPPLGVTPLAVERGRQSTHPPGAVRSSAGRLEAAWGSVAGGADGFDWRAGGGRTLRGIVDLWSERDAGDTYTFQPMAHDRGDAAQWGEVRPGWRGPLVATLSRPFDIPGRITGEVHVRVDAGSDLLRVVVEGENLAGGHRLRVGIPVPHAGRTVADLHYGPVTRTRESFDRHAHPAEWPVLTAPAHRYVSVPAAHPDPGVTLFPRGVSEYELTPDNVLALTGFRAVDQLSRGDLRARPGHAGWPAPTPDARELGPFRIEFALARRAVDQDAPPADWHALEALADEFHRPLAGSMLRAFGNGGGTRGPALEGEGLVFTCLKPALEGQGVVARCVNVTDRPVEGVWEWPGPLEGAARARLDEKTVRDLGHDGDPARVPFTAQPREVVTVLLWPERA